MVSSISTRRNTSDSKTCMVPLFLSTKSQRSMYSQRPARSQRSQSSTRGMIDPDAPPMPRAARTAHSRSRQAGSPIQRPSRAASATNQSDLYAAYPPPQRQDTSTMSLPTDSTVSSNSTNTTTTSHSRSTSSSSRPRKPPTHKRRTTTRTARLATHVSAKKRLTVCFTTTLLVATVIYVVLFATKAASGVLFHVFSILLLLSLAGVAAHSCIRWLMLKREWEEARERRERKRKSPRERGWVIGRPYEVKVGGRRLEGAAVGMERVMGDDEVPERPIEVFMRGDEEAGGDVDEEEGLGGGMGGEERLRHEGADVGVVIGGGGGGGGGLGRGSRLQGLAGRVRPPPPVYGNFRNSVRMNPDFLHVRQVSVPPSPSTPTYEQAVNQAAAAGPKLPGMAGYRPPSYGSEGGLTAVLETRRRDVEAAMGRVHPLERERLDRLGFRA